MTYTLFPGNVTHREVRHYQEHVKNILENPRHEAKHMKIDTDLYSDKELIWECFRRLVLYPYSNEQEVKKKEKPFKAEVTFDFYDPQEKLEPIPCIINSPKE